MPANCCREVFKLPDIPELTPVYFVALQLRDASGNALSDNFYWLASKDPADLASLDRLPAVRLKSSCQVRREGRQWVARVEVENPTEHVAMLVHLVLTKGPRGEEILPVSWDDNYFSLAPGERREVGARVAADAAGEPPPSFEVGGWNIETDYRCLGMHTSKGPFKVGQPVTVSATIAETFLAGSRVTLSVDGEPSGSQWAWARGERSAPLSFEITPSGRGPHQVALGAKTVTMEVE